MMSTVLLALGVSVVLVAYRVVSGLQKNIAAAKASGLPYYITPINPVNIFAQLSLPLWTGIWKCLPRRYWDPIMDICTPAWQYHENHNVFNKLGGVFMVISPFHRTIYTDNAEAIHQCTSKRESFPKPLQAYRILTLFGQNVVTTEGPIWRMHRKVTSASFNEKNSALVFKVAVEQAKGMVQSWLNRGAMDRIETLESDTMELALNIISYVGFGLRLCWPGQTLPSDYDPKLAKYAGLEVPKGYTMSFKESIAGVLHHVVALLIIPKFVLEKLPIKSLQPAREARFNYEKYMEEFLADKVEDIRNGNREEGMDIMGSLAATSYQDDTANGKDKGGKTKLSDSEIIGNAFIMFLAGHETSANVIHFTLLQLANNPGTQRRLQKDIDQILGNTDSATWDYDEKVNDMMASMLGTCMNETLRTLPPVVEVPKSVPPDREQILTIDGQAHTLPGGTYIGLVGSAAHRNPRYWPTKPSAVTSASHDLDDWVPERWYRASLGDTHTVEGADTEDFGGFSGPDTSAQLFRPVRGSYLPFSDGARSCLGRRIAQVEIIAALSVIFQHYSIENVVDEWVSDEQLATMGREQKADIYAKATAKSRKILAEAKSTITLKLAPGSYVPVRLVKRGEERFVDWYDA